MSERRMTTVMMIAIMMPMRFCGVADTGTGVMVG